MVGFPAMKGKPLSIEIVLHLTDKSKYRGNRKQIRSFTVTDMNEQDWERVCAAINEDLTELAGRLMAAGDTLEFRGTPLTD
jgi:L-asparaginase/Glu-tRNA(Gln) amidotransferase subunit D